MVAKIPRPHSQTWWHPETLAVYLRCCVLLALTRELSHLLKAPPASLPLRRRAGRRQAQQGGASRGSARPGRDAAEQVVVKRQWPSGGNGPQLSRSSWLRRSRGYVVVWRVWLWLRGLCPAPQSGPSVMPPHLVRVSPPGGSPPCSNRLIFILATPKKIFLFLLLKY